MVLHPVWLKMQILQLVIPERFVQDPACCNTLLSTILMDRVNKYKTVMQDNVTQECAKLYSTTNEEVHQST